MGIYVLIFFSPHCQILNICLGMDFLCHTANPVVIFFGDFNFFFLFKYKGKERAKKKMGPENSHEENSQFSL